MGSVYAANRRFEMSLGITPDRQIRADRCGSLEDLSEARRLYYVAPPIEDFEVFRYSIPLKPEK